MWWFYIDCCLLGVMSLHHGVSEWDRHYSLWLIVTLVATLYVKHVKSKMGKKKIYCWMGSYKWLQNSVINCNWSNIWIMNDLFFSDQNITLWFLRCFSFPNIFMNLTILFLVLYQFFWKASVMTVAILIFFQLVLLDSQIHPPTWQANLFQRSSVVSVLWEVGSCHNPCIQPSLKIECCQIITLKHWLLFVLPPWHITYFETGMIFPPATTIIPKILFYTPFCSCACILPN